MINSDYPPKYNNFLYKCSNGHNFADALKGSYSNSYAQFIDDIHRLMTQNVPYPFGGTYLQTISITQLHLFRDTESKIVETWLKFALRKNAEEECRDIYRYYEVINNLFVNYRFYPNFFTLEKLDSALLLCQPNKRIAMLEAAIEGEKTAEAFSKAAEKYEMNFSEENKMWGWLSRNFKIGIEQSYIQKIPPEERNAACRQIIPSISRNQNHCHPEYIVQAACFLPKEARTEEVIHHFCTIYRWQTNRTSIIDEFLKIPTQERTPKLIAAFFSLFKFNELSYNDVIELIHSFTVNELVEILNKMHSTLISEDIDLQLKISILKQLKEIPAADRTVNLIQSLRILLDGLNLSRHEVLRVLSQIPIEERAMAVEGAAQFNDPLANAYVRAALVYACSKPERIKTLQLLSAEIDKTNLPYKSCLKIIAAFLPPDQCTQYKVREIHACDYILSAIKGLSCVPKDDRTYQTIEIVGTALMRRLHDGPDVWDVVDDEPTPFELLHLISPEVYETIAVQPNEWLRNNDILEEVFLHNALREPCCRHLEKLLQSDLPPNLKWTHAKNILYMREVLHLHEEHPVIQLTIATASICDPDALQNPKNPYKVYEELKKIVSTETLFVTSTERWNFAKLQEKGEWKGFSVKDLPKGVGPNTLKELFEELEKRLKELDEKTREEIESYISEICGQSLKSLRENLIDKPFLGGILNNEDHKETVSPLKFQLFAALRAILDADGTLKENEKLTAREEMLLKMSASIQNCSTGQRDGLANYYNLLPDSYKRGPKAKEGAEADAEAFVDACVQKMLNATFSSEEFLRKVVEDEIIVQQSHVTEYLKNRYHRHVGLQHQLVFDAHTGVLPDKLFERKTEDVLSIFFQLCTPLKTIKQIETESKDALASGKFTGIKSLLNIDTEEDYRKFFTFDEETVTPIQLTEKGATALLTNVGYLLTEAYTAN